MTVTAEQLAAELKTARRGRGLYHPDIHLRIGPGLRTVCDIQDADLPSVVRSKAVNRLREMAGTLPADLATAALAALGIHPEVRDQLQLQDRMEWLARRLVRDIRTARRRVDEACALLAESAVAAPNAAANPRRSHGWYVERYEAAVVLDAETPTVVERRVVVAERDGIDQLVLSWSVPRIGDGHPDVLVQMLYGGVLVEKNRATASRFRFVLALPRTLRSGERHEYGMLLWLPPNQPMRPLYVYTPASRCDYFVLRVRFDRQHAPKQIWRVVDSFHRDLDEQPDGETVLIDRAGEVHVEFDDIMPGYGYGIRWE